MLWKETLSNQSKLSQNPLRGYLDCQAKYTPGELEPWLRKALERDGDGKDIAGRLADERGQSIRFSMQTSQAVDISEVVTN